MVDDLEFTSTLRHGKVDDLAITRESTDHLFDIIEPRLLTDCKS